MKKLWKYAWRLTLLVTFVAGWGCSAEPSGDMAPDYSDKGPWGDYITAFGWIEESRNLDQEMCVITTDEGYELSVVELSGALSQEELIPGRIMCNYSIIANKQAVANGFWVRLNRLYSLEVREMEVYDRGDVLSAGYECLGAPAMPYQVSIGGGCVNINVLYSAFKQPSEVVPDVKIHYDLRSSTADTSLFQLEYTEGDEVEGGNLYDRYQWFSFVIPEEYVEVISASWTYAFQWRWWREGEYGNHSAGYVDQTSVMNPNSWDERQQPPQPGI